MSLLGQLGDELAMTSPIGGLNRHYTPDPAQTAAFTADLMSSKRPVPCAAGINELAGMAILVLPLLGP
jgi:hypothetical protein